MGKDILAIVDTGGKDGQFIGNAIALASRHDARLILGLACPIPVPGSPSAFGLPYATAAEFNEAVAAKEARIRSLARESGITVRIFLDDPVVLLRRLAAEASLSDVILFGSVESYGSPRFRSELVEAVVFASGRPVLLQPEGVGVETWKRIVIGWNGTREAGRALHAAMSIAPPEASFDIVTVTRPGEDARRLQPSAADVARHLEMLGRTAAAHYVDSGGQSAAGALIAFSHIHQADLIAAGAYGHSRLREMVFGGMTKALLRGGDIGILLEH